MLIEINLLPGKKKRKRAAGAGIQMPDFGALIAQVKDPLLIGAVAAWVLGMAAVAGLFVTDTARAALLENEAGRLRAEHRRFQALINQKRRAERLRDSLVAELTAIRRVDADRYVWAHVLDEVSRALPSFTWLIGMGMLPQAPVAGDTTALPPVRVQITGRTSDIAAYTRFARQLAASPWFSSVELGSNQTVIEDGKAITAFTITVTYGTADSAFIQTVPLRESVR